MPGLRRPLSSQVTGSSILEDKLSSQDSSPHLLQPLNTPAPLATPGKIAKQCRGRREGWLDGAHALRRQHPHPQPIRFPQPSVAPADKLHGSQVGKQEKPSEPPPPPPAVKGAGREGGRGSPQLPQAPPLARPAAASLKGFAAPAGGWWGRCGQEAWLFLGLDFLICQALSAPGPSSSTCRRVLT